MSISIKGWTIVREFSSDSPSEESYIRNEAIQRVSIIENDDKTASVLVHALGTTYLAVVSDSLQEAHRQLVGIVQDISQK